MIEHFVLFKAKPGQSDDVDAALREYEAGIRDLPSLLELTWGPNMSERSVEMGWTHGMLTRLTDYDAFLNEYWPHEAHEVLLPKLDASCEVRFAIDYEVEDPKVS